MKKLNEIYNVKEKIQEAYIGMVIPEGQME